MSDMAVMLAIADHGVRISRKAIVPKEKLSLVYNAVDQFKRRITFEADPGPTVTDKIAEIAGKCPVHRTLESRSDILTEVGTS